jgi:hypothetical protein
MSSLKPRRLSSPRTRIKPPSEVTRALKLYPQSAVERELKRLFCVSTTTSPPPHRLDHIQAHVRQRVFRSLSN